MSPRGCRRFLQSFAVTIVPEPGPGASPASAPGSRCSYCCWSRCPAGRSSCGRRRTADRSRSARGCDTRRGPGSGLPDRAGQRRRRRRRVRGGRVPLPVPLPSCPTSFEPTPAAIPPRHQVPRSRNLRRARSWPRPQVRSGACGGSSTMDRPSTSSEHTQRSGSVLGGLRHRSRGLGLASARAQTAHALSALESRTRGIRCSSPHAFDAEHGRERL